MKKVIMIVLLAYFCLPGFSEQYRIDDVRYQISGRTQEYALKLNVPVDKKTIFNSHDELEKYIAELQQKYRNQRTLNTAEITTSFLEAGADNVIPVILDIITTDSRNFLILPYPKYDSNSGFTLKLKAKDNNFLGLMLPLSADFFYESKQDSEDDAMNHTLGINFNYTLPFSLSIFDLEWINDLSLSYGIVDEQFKFSVSTGLRATLPFDRFRLQLTAKQTYTWNPEYDAIDDTSYFTEYGQFAVPVELFSISVAKIYVMPYIHIIYNWDTDGISDPDLVDPTLKETIVLNNRSGISHPDLIGPVFGGGYSFSSSHINWIGNYRNGFSAALSQSLNYNTYKEKTTHMLSGEVKTFSAFKYLSFNSRSYAFTGVPWNDDSFLWGTEDIGDRIRGVRDSQTGLKGVTAALIVNLDLPVKLVQTDWRSWGETFFQTRMPDFFRFFDFELQAAPFIDVAFTRNEQTGRVFSPKDGWYGAGLELLLYPNYFRSYVFRISFGIDLGRFMYDYLDWKLIDKQWRNEPSKYELFIGIEAHY